MEAKSFQEMLKEGTLTGSDTLTATGVAMIVIGVLAILAPLASGVLFDMLFGALFVGAGVVELIEAFRSGTWQRGVLLALAGLVTLVAGSSSSGGLWWAWSGLRSSSSPSGRGVDGRPRANELST
jgi:uncharacterized membrane protein HdeD (DUF308 family)